MTIRLTYFDIPFWRAEASRIALSLGRIPFDDIRTSSEVFEEMKAAGSLPYEQLPVLEVNGTKIAQSVAIARFCAKRAGFYPTEDDVAAARVDELLDTATQITNLFLPSFQESDSQKKIALREELATRDLPKWFGFLEDRLRSNGDTRYFVGLQMSIADLVMWRLLGWITGGGLDGIPTDLLDPHPTLQDHFRNVDSHAGVRAWMDRHYGDC